MAIQDVNPTQLILRTAQELKKESVVRPAPWAQFVKTGMSKERAPMQEDWWFVRSAAILRKIYLLGPVGTSKLRTKFSSRKNNGMAPEHVYPGAGNHIRKILQQLEKAGFAKQISKGVHKGRILTPKGISFLDKVAIEMLKEQGIVIPAGKKHTEQSEVHEEKPKVKKPRAPRKKKEKKVP